LDQILGKQGSKAKDVYASKISLASRVVKVERQVRIFCLDSKHIHSNHRCMKFTPTCEKTLCSTVILNYFRRGKI